MLAAVLNGVPQTHLELRDDVSAFDPGTHEVTVRILAVGLCHSDLSAMSGSLYIPTPAVMGHEGAGVVEAVGDGVTSVRVGDHVVVSVSFPCGKCLDCTTRDSRHLCTKLFFDVAARPHFHSGSGTLAAMGAVGAFSERVAVREETLIPVPGDMPAEFAALLSCGVVAGVGAIRNQCRVQPGSTVVVVGMGGVGLSAVQGARMAGADVIVAIEPHASRRALAERVGATHAFEPNDAKEAMQSLTEGGFDFAVEAAGSATAMRAAWDLVRRGGTVCVVGMAGESEMLQLTANEIYYSEKNLVGSYHGSSNFRRDVPMLVDAWRHGDLDLDALLTSRRPLTEINDAIDEMRAGVGARCVLLPSGSARS